MLSYLYNIINSINITSVSFILSYHFIAIYGLFNYQLTNIDIASTLVMSGITGIGITMGYHRLWSHRSYKANTLLKILLAFFGAGASEGSILWWSKYHRLHHYKSDTNDDPYGPQKGFLYSHILWIFENRYLPKLNYVNVDDLKNDDIVMFQHNYYVLISLLCSVGLPFIYYISNNYDLIHCLFFPIALSRILTWHSTWFVNSLAHSFGTQPYGRSGTSRNHIFTALLTFGEGNHNYHHEFPYDYRNGIKWYEYDPTKLFIELCYLLGLVYDLKKKEDLYEDLYIHKNKSTYKNITIEEYKNSQYDLIMMNNNIYDLSDFIDKHPGGEKYIKQIIRKDQKYIEEMFNKINNHTLSAYKILNNMKVGKIEN
jgi:stearoyl-CoA desaturase (delta-9 desaturase)